MKILNNGVLETLDISEVSIVDGLVGWWPLNGNTKDISKNKNHGTIIGTIPEASGIEQLCYNFSGDWSNHIKLPIEVFQNMQDYTISFWVNIRNIAEPRITCILHEQMLEKILYY